MTLLESFCEWAGDPARTSDELYTAELLIETAEATWAYRHRKVDADWHERRRAFRHRRRMLPGYRATLGRERFERAADFWAEVTMVENRFGENPPVRNLAALRFCPQLKQINFSSELTDLAPFAGLPALEQLWLDDATLMEVGALARLTTLRNLQLRLHWPWPSGLDALARLPGLRTVCYTGNQLSWEGLAELSALEELELRSDYSGGLPLRNLRGLPAMPRLRKLRVDTVALTGIDRYPALVELELHGPFSDLGPLSRLPAVRKLQLHGERFGDLVPLARMPELRELVLEREHGLDLDPLAEAPRLRKVEASRCTVLSTELASLNTALGVIDESEFVRAMPRTWPPLRLIACNFPGKEFRSLPPLPDDEFAREERERLVMRQDDPIFGAAEAGWFERELRKRIGSMMTPGWGRFWASAGSVHVSFYRESEATQIREIVEALRQVMARARFPWRALIAVGPPDENDLLDDELNDQSKKDEFDVEQEREEWAEGQRSLRERQEFLEREHRQRLREQQGLAPEPAVVGPDDIEAEEAVEDDEDDDEEAFELAPGMVDYDRGFVVNFDGAIVWLPPSYVENVSYYFSEAPEDWHELPGPPELRPRLR